MINYSSVSLYSEQGYSTYLGVSDTQRERRDLLTVDRRTIVLRKASAYHVGSQPEHRAYPYDTPVKVVLQVGRDLLGTQVINVAQLVSQGTSERDGSSYNSTTFAIGDTFLARSARVAREHDV